MELEFVDSSLINAIGYDDATETMAVRFAKNNKLYHYPGVKRSEFEDVKNSPSVGRAFLDNIRDAYVGVHVPQ